MKYHRVYGWSKSSSCSFTVFTTCLILLKITAEEKKRRANLMAALLLCHNALITRATKVYLGHSTCTKCREVINFASQLGKSAFQHRLLCARCCQWKLNTVMNFLVRIKLSIFSALSTPEHSLRMPSRLRREAESSVSCHETCCWSSEAITPVWRTGACIHLFE